LVRAVLRQQMHKAQMGQIQRLELLHLLVAEVVVGMRWAVPEGLGVVHQNHTHQHQMELQIKDIEAAARQIAILAVVVEVLGPLV
jgi:hypothetical protein